MSNTEGGVSAMSAELGPLPEPWDYCYEWDGLLGTRKFSAAAHNGSKPTRSVPLFTAEQMSTYAAQQLAAERERCANACREWQAGRLSHGIGTHDLLRAIEAPNHEVSGG